MQNYTKRRKQSGTRDRDFDRNILYAPRFWGEASAREKEEIIISSWGRNVFVLRNSRGTSICLRQRDCTSIRETKLFPFHGKKRERREGKSRQRAQLYRSRDSTHSIAFLSLERRRIEIRLLFARRLTTDGIQGSRHVSRRSSPGFNYSVRKWSVYSLISPVTNHVNRWERTSFVWRCSFTRIPTTMLDGERGRGARKSIENNPRGD